MSLTNLSWNWGRVVQTSMDSDSLLWKRNNPLVVFQTKHPTSTSERWSPGPARDSWAGPDLPAGRVFFVQDWRILTPVLSKYSRIWTYWIRQVQRSIRPANWGTGWLACNIHLWWWCAAVCIILCWLETQSTSHSPPCFYISLRIACRSHFLGVLHFCCVHYQNTMRSGQDFLIIDKPWHFTLRIWLWLFV